MKLVLARPFFRPLLSLLAAISLLACSSGDTASDDSIESGACSGVLAGDLVITEVMANPPGEDRGFEYFEVYNAASAPIDLAGLTLAYSLPDGSAEETHEVTELTVVAGDYVALGSAESDALPVFMDYGFDNDLGSLRNAGAVLALRCGETEVDRIEYPSVEGEDGVAWGLDGAVAPDHIANDDGANFCLATTEFAEGMLGSPGEANEDCNPVLFDACTEAGRERTVVLPAAGDLVITEFMAAPAGADDGEEWFEVYAARDVDLNGLVVGRDAGAAELTIDDSACLPLAAGDYAVFAHDETANGGLAQVIWTFDFALVPDRLLYIGIGNQVLDQITTAPVAPNASTALDPDMLDPTANDDPSVWSSCSAPYGPGENSGTPGASNASCGGGVVEGTCLDGSHRRAIVPPQPGQIRITEAMANPQGLDRLGEWFEIQALADFDLNGLGFNEDDTDEIAFTIDGDDCMPVASGDLVLLARNAMPAMNGGLPPVDHVFAFDLNNGNGRLFVLQGDALLDQFAYGNATEGRARQLDPQTEVICNATTAFPPPDGAQTGTPGAVNESCPLE